MSLTDDAALGDMEELTVKIKVGHPHLNSFLLFFKLLLYMASFGRSEETDRAFSLLGREAGGRVCVCLTIRIFALQIAQLQDIIDVILEA